MLTQEDLAALIAFIRARLDEDERAARRSLDAPADALRYSDVDEWTESLTSLMTENRVLREVAAKRRMVATCEQWLSYGPVADWEIDRAGDDSFVVAAETMLRLAAAPYADHADYQQRWTP